MFVNPETSDDSLQFIRDGLDSLEHRGRTASATSDLTRQRTRRFVRLAADPITLELLTTENVPTAFYLTPTPEAAYGDLAGAAAYIESLPNVLRVDIDPSGRPNTPGVSDTPTTTSSTDAATPSTTDKSP